MTFAERALRRPRLAWALIAEPVDPLVDAERLAYRARYAALIAEALSQGIAAGELPEQDAGARRGGARRRLRGGARGTALATGRRPPGDRCRPGAACGCSSGARSERRSMAEAVRVERDGPVTTVLLHRPERRNAVDGATADALAQAFRAFDADPDAAVAVLHGEGGTFCAGADLQAVGTERRQPRQRRRRRPDGPDPDAARQACDRRGRRATRSPAASSWRCGATCGWSSRARCSACTAAAGGCR